MGGFDDGVVFQPRLDGKAERPLSEVRGDFEAAMLRQEADDARRAKGLKERAEVVGEVLTGDNMRLLMDAFPGTTVMVDQNQGALNLSS